MKRSIVLMVLMCCAALGAFAIKPTKLLADQLPPIHLEAMVPKAFGEWRAVEQGALQVINPQAETLVNTLYQEVLNRVYVNQSGYAVMLSIAYGRDQRDGMQAHVPEVCYPAQGFQVQSVRWAWLNIADAPISAKRLVTQMQQRHEPLTYWHVVGEKVTTGGLNKKTIEMQYAMQGLVPDGMLVRASSIDADTQKAHLQQEAFLQALLQAISPDYRHRFGG